MRDIIAALQVTVDGFIAGREGDVDWIETWEDSFDLLPQIDACIIGGGTYPGYERYWRAILANPKGILPLTGRAPTKGEIEYAQFADRTPHIVLSTTLDNVSWQTARIVRDVEDILALKQETGKDMHAVGGATLVSSLMNEGLVDELRLTVHPIVLGEGKALLKDVKDRHMLEYVRSKPLTAGRVSLTYRTAR